MEQLRAQLADAVNAQDTMNTALKNMDVSAVSSAYARLNDIVNNTERNIRDNINEQANFNNEVKNGTRAVQDLGNAGSGIKKIFASIVGVFSVKAATNFFQGSLDAVNETIAVEQRLANIMSNRGATYEEFIRLQERAMDIQMRTTIDDTAMLGAANELARHLDSIDAVEIMMGSLADFAAGTGNMFGATAQDMTNYAQYFTQAMMGNYRMLERRAGIFLTETQKEVIKYGDDMQKALLIQDIVSASWGGLAEQMAATPRGMQEAISQSVTDIRERFMTQLLPVIMLFFTTIQGHLPRMEQMLMSIVPAVEAIINAMIWLIDRAFAVYDVMVNNWSTIEPILWGLVGAFVAWKTITILLTAKNVILNAVLAMNPAKAIAMAIIILIGVIVAWIRSVGGIQIAWLIMIGAVQTAWDWFKIGMTAGVHGIIWLFERMELGVRAIGNGIANIMGNITSSVLLGVENMVNKAIPLLNNLIRAANFVTRGNMGLIENVTFGTDARANHEANRLQREADYRARQSEFAYNTYKRYNQRQEMKYDAQSATAARRAEIDYLRAQTYEEYYVEADFYTTNDFIYTGGLDGEGFGSIARNVGNIADNTGRAANIGEENLKLWKDIANRDTINRFTTARVAVSLGGVTNNVNSNMDLDGVVSYIVEAAEEALAVTAERVVEN